MFWPLRLKNPIGKPYNMGPEDTLAAKRILASLGHMEVPDYGIDEYQDQPMIDAVKSFQRNSGLREDGIMKPGDETEAGLNAAIRAMNEETRTALGRGNGSNEIRGSGQPIKMANAYRRRFPGDRWGPEGAMKSGGFFSDGGGWGAATVSTAAAAKILLNQRADKVGGGEVPQPHQSRQHSRRSLLENPPPPNPGYEPPDEQLPDRTESPPSIIEIPSIENLPAERAEPTVFILPAPKPDEFGNGIVERKGNEATRQELMRIRDYLRSLGWKHIAGGRYAPDDPAVSDKQRKKTTANGERSEWHIKRHFGGLKGGHFTDLTFRDTRGRIVHVQTVDVDRSGKPSQRELDTADRIWRAIGRKRLVGEEEEDLILIPKGAQLDRIRRFRNNR
ncbi:MAG: peptidoglycan-binding domain-containing protein [Rhodospirillales bacterium]